MMTDAELTSKVKIMMFGSDQGNWRDDMINGYIAEVKEYMLDAGVPDAVLHSEKALGCIVMGVNDLWNYTSGGVKFSQYFDRRVTQLASGKTT